MIIQLLVGLILLLIVVFSVLISKITERARKSEKEKADAVIKLMETEFKALRAQLNPHFLFNSLNSIRLFILKNDSEKADDYISKFARLLRLVLNHSRKDMISVFDEIQALKLYLEFEQLRFEQKFDFDLQIDGQEVLNQMIPPMIIQPFVEIWHGLMPRKNNEGKIKVSFQKQVSGLYISIQDNGVGRAAAQKIKSNQSINEGSVGLAITKERLNILKQKSSLQNELEIEDLFDESNQASGTLVNLYFESNLTL
jgi:LytS/YehU family sensor histidine kinase